MSDAPVGPLPYRWNATVVDAKLAYYLSDAHRRTSRDKSTLFGHVLGFRAEHPAMLRAALVRHARVHDAVVHDVQPEWLIYNVTGPFDGPSGVRIERMVTGWAILRGSFTPMNVTAFPERRRRA